MALVLWSLLACVALHAIVEVLASRGTLLLWASDRPGFLNLLLASYVGAFLAFASSVGYLLWSIA